MATESSSPMSTISISPSPSLPSSTQTLTQTLPNNLITINSSTQIPLKLTPVNYPAWKAQWDVLLFGYDLLGYIDDSTPCPPVAIDETGTPVANSARTFWLRQDKLLLLAMTASLSNAVIPMVSSSQTSAEAWNKLKKLYASRSCSCIMGLKESFIKLSRGSSSVGDYLYRIKGIVDDLTLAGDPPSNDSVVLHTLNEIGSEFKEISAAIRARDIVISFEELHDKLIEYESFSNEKKLFLRYLRN